MGKKFGKRGHLLVTKEVERKLEKSPIGAWDGRAAEAPVIVKFFSPYNGWTWYITEGERDNADWLLYGYVIGYEAEFGYVMLSELEAAEKDFGGTKVPAVERDCYFGDHKLGEFLR
jgi:hypothetical protein